MSRLTPSDSAFNASLMPSDTPTPAGMFLIAGQRFLVGIAQRQQRIEDVGDCGVVRAARRRRRRGRRRACPSVPAAGARRSSCRCRAPSISRPASCSVTACARSATDMPDRIDSAVRAPTPVILISWRNTARSLALPKPNSSCASSRIAWCVNSTTFSPSVRQVVKGAHRHVDFVADALAIDQQLRRIFFEQDSGEATDHRWTFR